jgi:uncharacterized membrane protein YagU involved in acid resistance
MQLHTIRAVTSGLAGTAAMTAVLLMAPAMGMPPMDIGKMLASRMGGIVALGWSAHFVIGVILAVIYAAAFARILPGPAMARGALYGLLPWLAAQLVVMPMMGMGLFSGSMAMAGGSLMGHLVYGAGVGLIYGLPDGYAPAPRPAHA